MAEIDRRTLLRALGGVAVTPALARQIPPTGPASRGRVIRAALLAARSAAQTPQPSFQFNAIRADDMLNLGFQFFNAHSVVKGGQTFVVPTDTSQPALMVVAFQSQHIGEETAAFSVITQSFPLPPLPGALSGISWLAFELPKQAEIPLTIEGCSPGQRCRRSLSRSWRTPAAASPRLPILSTPRLRCLGRSGCRRRPTAPGSMPPRR